MACDVGKNRDFPSSAPHRSPVHHADSGTDGRTRADTPDQKPMADTAATIGPANYRPVRFAAEQTTAAHIHIDGRRVHSKFASRRIDHAPDATRVVLVFIHDGKSCGQPAVERSKRPVHQLGAWPLTWCSVVGDTGFESVTLER
jgi:hypothetical protein